MDRREFLRTGLAALAGGCWANRLTAESSKPATTATTGRYKLKYAPHFGMFKHSAGDDLIDQLRFAADQGFVAWQDNGLQDRPVAVQEKIGRALAALGMEMGLFAGSTAFPDAASAQKNGPAWEPVLRDIRHSVEVAKRVNGRWVSVALGICGQGRATDVQTAGCVELLKRCCGILEPHGLVLVLGPPGGASHDRGMFARRIPPAELICQAVNSPSCKILFDVYSREMTGGRLISGIDSAWSEIAYFQCGDNPGRKEPGTGSIDYRSVFGHLSARGYAGVVGMEHGNARPGAEGERAVIDAYLALERIHGFVSPLQG